MNKKIISILVVGLVALVSGLGIVMNQDDSGDTENSSSNNEQKEQNTGDKPEFAPRNTFEESFVATITGVSGGQEFNGLLEFDGNGNGKFSSDDGAGSSIEFFFSPDSFINCTEGNCFRASNTGPSPFDTDQYILDDEDFNEFKETAKYEGIQDCPAGTCDVWLVKESNEQDSSVESLETKIFLAVDDQRISQVVGNQNGETTTIVYEFKNVTIIFPENIQEIPNFNL